jgi:hypothetical protein
MLTLISPPKHPRTSTLPQHLTNNQGMTAPSHKQHMTTNQPTLTYYSTSSFPQPLQQSLINFYLPSSQHQSRKTPSHTPSASQDSLQSTTWRKKMQYSRCSTARLPAVSNPSFVTPSTSHSQPALTHLHMYPQPTKSTYHPPPASHIIAELAHAHSTTKSETSLLTQAQDSNKQSHTVFTSTITSSAPSIQQLYLQLGGTGVVTPALPSISTNTTLTPTKHDALPTILSEHIPPPPPPIQHHHHEPAPLHPSTSYALNTTSKTLTISS